MKNQYFKLELLDGAQALWRYLSANGQELPIAPPRFEIDGQTIVAAIENATEVSNKVLPHGPTETVWRGKVCGQVGLHLQIRFQTSPENPVVRFRYTLMSDTARRLTKDNGCDNLAYLGLDFSKAQEVTEVRFSEFRENIHSFCLSEQPVHDRDFENSLAPMGPMLVGSNVGSSFLVAYEHGSPVPGAFLHYHLSPNHLVELRAVKGNYFNGQQLGPDSPFESVWFQFAATSGDTDQLAQHYRDFVLRYMSPNTQSRKPYVFYNTWNYQERNKHWYDKPYLAEMNEERMLAEIDVAHRMGIEVFVIDTGWYQKTGDWQVSSERFPSGLGPIKQKLDGYGMKLGLWFDPCAASISSNMFQDHKDCTQVWQGQEREPHEIWETESSYKMCLSSRYADAFGDELIRLVREVGVTYFKWDAIHQYTCDASNHDHGDGNVSEQERADCQAYRQGQAMTRIVDKLCAACPEAIVDFDITEGGRFVGLGFLSAGKYFLINNGPYHFNYDMPLPADKNWNLFFWPGPARSWICREPLAFDKWIPSVLLLTHYLPDDHAEYQTVSIASLILGQNGIWGDLLRISDEGIELFNYLLSLYKQVRDDITRAYPVRNGNVAGSPEVHEKIHNGRGAVCIFASTEGEYTYVTQHSVDQNFHATPGADVSFDSKGRAIIKSTFPFGKSAAQVVFFGVQ